MDWYPYWVNHRTLEVHSYDCPHFPRGNEVYLGRFSSLRMAMTDLRVRGIDADPCFFCKERESSRLFCFKGGH